MLTLWVFYDTLLIVLLRYVYFTVGVVSLCLYDY